MGGCGIKLMFPELFSGMSTRAIEVLWVEFSNIQKAEYLTVDKETLDRFVKWVASGNDEDAWS